MTATIVLPESGPTSSSNSRKSCTPVLASLSVVSSPSTKAPMPVARTAAATGPVGRSISSSWLALTLSLICVSSCDRRRLRDQRAEEAGNRREHERGSEDDKHEQPRGPVPGECRPVVEDEEGSERGEHRGKPGDVFLPLHAEFVPILGVAGSIREQEVPRRALVAGDLRSLAAGALLARQPLPIPRVDDPRACDHRRPGRDRHCRRTDLQPPDTLADAGRGDVLGAQTPKTGEAAGERDQEESPDDQTVNERPRLAIREFHPSSARLPKFCHTDRLACNEAALRARKT